MRRWLALLTLPVALMLSVGSSSALAQRGDLEEERRAVGIYRNTQSPFCPGRTLDDCPSESAATWRRDIRTWVGEGATNAEIRERLAARAQDFDLSGREGVPGWLFALGAFATVAGALAWAMRRRSPPVEAAPSASADDDAALDARLDEELGRL